LTEAHAKACFNAVKIMSTNLFKKPISFYLFCLVFFLSLFPVAFALQKVGSDDRGQEASASQAQATMASLFGRGAKMPVIPQMRGTIALPSFDSSKMKVDEGSLNAAQRREHSSGNG